MNDLQKNKIQKFINDKAMSETIYKVLLDSFLIERPSADVYVLAASRLAIDYLKQGWQELERFKAENEKEDKQVGNVGV